jgi:hypothetical protein
MIRVFVTGARKQELEGSWPRAGKPRDAAAATKPARGNSLSEGVVTNALEWQHLHGVAAEVLNAFGRSLEALR